MSSRKEIKTEKEEKTGQQRKRIRKMKGRKRETTRK